jgi:DNA-binding beta-propeller fold protein YncE
MKLKAAARKASQTASFCVPGEAGLMRADYHSDLVRPLRTMSRIALVIVLAASAGVRAAGSDYLLFVASEAADTITLVRFNTNGGRVEREIPTGIMPTAIDGPHGLAVAPDGRSFFVSLAHGQPYGAVWKYSTTGDREVVSRVTLGSFPATLQVSPNGDFLYVVNFNLHGDHVPSSVSVVDTASMVEIKRITTCVMPHGSRFDPSGARHYSACMMDDALVEIDTAALRVSRHFILTKGRERAGVGAPPPTATTVTGHEGHGIEPSKAADAMCSPTWAQPSVDGRSIFVACNGSNDLVEIETASWRIKRRIAARNGIYNLAVTKDGKVIATNRRDQSASIFDTTTGQETARISLPRKAAHGVVVSPDDRYAFVTVEGVAAEPGTVVMIDIKSAKAIASVDVAAQAGGIDLWKVE